MRYVYSVIRYVPNPASGEFVNIGAIAGSDEAGDWEIRQAGNPKRARGFGPLESLNVSFAFMIDLGRRLDDTDSIWGEPISEQWLVELQQRHRNIVQLSSPAPVVADSAADALEFVFGQVIAEAAVDPNSPRGYATRRSLIAELRTSYLRADVRPELLRERVWVTPNDDETRAPMDFVVGNGSALQLAHTWSFQVQGYLEVVKEVKAWGYTLRNLRKSGGTTDDERQAVIDRDVPVDVLYAEPRTREQMQVFVEAQQVFRSLGVKAVPQADVTEVADQARARLRESGLPGLMLG